MSKIVKYERSSADPQPLTDTQKAEIDALKQMSDANINYDDIPPLSDGFWANATRNPHPPKVRKQRKRAV